jgi:L-rhamnose-H+ transport protein
MNSGPLSERMCSGIPRPNITSAKVSIAGTVICGMGAASLGALGGIVGWPIFMTIDIIGALFWGAVSGEWRRASRRARVYNWAGVGVLLVAIAVISAGNAT